MPSSPVSSDRWLLCWETLFLDLRSAAIGLLTVLGDCDGILRSNEAETLYCNKNVILLPLWGISECNGIKQITGFKTVAFRTWMKLKICYMFMARASSFQIAVTITNDQWQRVVIISKTCDHFAAWFHGDVLLLRHKQVSNKVLYFYATWLECAKHKLCVLSSVCWNEAMTETSI